MTEPVWFDSHCHLQDQYRSGDLAVAEAVAEAVGAGVGGLVCVGTDAGTSAQALSLVHEIRAGEAEAGAMGAWATVGLHPHEASHGLGELEPVLTGAMEDRPGLVVAVGECGLDFHYDHSPRPAQREVFAAQIALAKAHGLALVVHTREAWDETLGILAEVGPPERTVIHCFTGGPEEARRCLELGAYLSFSGILTFKGAPEIREAARLCPTDRLLVETDAPFLAPVPHRGKQNRPAWVTVVGEAVAAVKGMDPAELATSATAATRAVFALG